MISIFPRYDFSAAQSLPSSRGVRHPVDAETADQESLFAAGHEQLAPVGESAVPELLQFAADAR
jgi:hypothetical protein